MLDEKVHRQIYTVLLAVLGVAMVSSVWLANLAWVLIGINWLAGGRWAEKWQRAKQSRPLHAVLAFCGLLLAGMLWTADTANGWSIMQVKLPLAVLPLVLLTSPPLPDRPRRAVAAVYVAAVTAVSIVAMIRMATIADLPYRQAVPHVSHIRFALNCCMVVYLAAGQLQRKEAPPALKAGMGLLAVWMVAVVMRLHSYTALGILAVVSIAVPLATRRWWAVALWLLAAGAVAAVAGNEVRRYYRLQPLSTQELQPCTANGRPYVHYRDGIVENGNYINNYICREELGEQWARRSGVPFDSLAQSGYSIESTLIRYLNACGYTKDSAGVASLTDGQVAAVEQGVANPVYQERHWLRQMVYTLLLEREYYRHTQAVAGFSTLQRLSLWKATVEVIAEHPLAGVGTGDVVGAMQEKLARQGSELAGRPMRSHNQYLGYAAAVGIPAAVAVLLLTLRAARTGWRRYRRGRADGMAFRLAWGLTIAVSMLTEDTLDTLAGILTAVFPLAFLPPAKEPHGEPPAQ